MVASTYRRVALKPRSFLAGTIALMAHGVVILFLLGVKHGPPLSNNPTIQMIQLKPDPVESVLSAEPPVVSFRQRAIHVDLPDIAIKADSVNLGLIRDPSATAYELPDRNMDIYRDVFDPKLRQKLIDAQVFNRPRTKGEANTWTEVDGRTFVDMGNGECLVSMRKVDSRERGTNWGMTRCGKTDSEKMMDNVNADLEARKHPLKTQ